MSHSDSNIFSQRQHAYKVKSCTLALLYRYGQTTDGKLVDSATLELLHNLGFETAVVAEALKKVKIHA